MAIIEGGNVIPANPAGGERVRVYPGSGAPVGGTTYDGIIQVGEFYNDVDNDNLYEYTGVDTFTRVDQ